jgi:hypothetical protein
MQGLFNLMAISSFAISAGLVGGGAYLYLNKDKIITEVVDNAKTTITAEITKALPSIINSVVEIPEMPEIPTVPSSTGPALPF